MELLLALVVAVLFGGGIYLVLSRVTLRIVMGTCVISYATYLYLMTIGKLQRGAAPILDAANDSYTDPVPQALILTAIVIGFGVTAFIIALAYRAYKSIDSDDMEDYCAPCDETPRLLQKDRMPVVPDGLDRGDFDTVENPSNAGEDIAAITVEQAREVDDE